MLACLDGLTGVSPRVTPGRYYQVDTNYSSEFIGCFLNDITSNAFYLAPAPAPTPLMGKHYQGGFGMTIVLRRAEHPEYSNVPYISIFCYLLRTAQCFKINNITPYIQMNERVSNRIGFDKYIWRTLMVVPP